MSGRALLRRRSLGLGPSFASLAEGRERSLLLRLSKLRVRPLVQQSIVVSGVSQENVVEHTEPRTALRLVHRVELSDAVADMLMFLAEDAPAGLVSARKHRQ